MRGGRVSPRAPTAPPHAFQVPGEVFLPVPAGLLAARAAGALLPKSPQGESRIGTRGSSPSGFRASGIWERWGRSGARGFILLSAPARRTSPASCSASRSTWHTSPARTSSSESLPRARGCAGLGFFCPKSFSRGWGSKGGKAAGLKLSFWLWDGGQGAFMVVKLPVWAASSPRCFDVFGTGIWGETASFGLVLAAAMGWQM